MEAPTECDNTTRLPAGTEDSIAETAVVDAVPLDGHREDDDPPREAHGADEEQQPELGPPEHEAREAELPENEEEAVTHEIVLDENDDDVENIIKDLDTRRPSFTQ
ncbi:hypothetical protein FOZ62_026454, partial [Perkinsus olseni]